LREMLPEYMMPAGFVFMPRLPRTISDKVQRLALPQWSAARPDLDSEYREPASHLEAEMVKHWEEVLKVRPIGTEDSFLDLGGDSLAALRMIAALERTFALHLNVEQLFDATVAGLAKIAESQAS